MTARCVELSCTAVTTGSEANACRRASSSWKSGVCGEDGLRAAPSLVIHGICPCLVLARHLAVMYGRERLDVNSGALVPDSALAGVTDGLSGIPDAGPESGYADDNGAADSDDGGRHKGVHAAQVGAAERAYGAVCADGLDIRALDASC